MAELKYEDGKLLGKMPNDEWQEFNNDTEYYEALEEDDNEDKEEDDN